MRVGTHGMMQVDPAEIERLVRCLLDDGLDVVLGNRLSHWTRMPPDRLAANLVMNLTTFLVCGQMVPDSQSGFKAITGEALRRMELSALRYEICSEIVGEITYKSLRYGCVPVQAAYTKYSRMKGQNFLNGINVILQLFSRVLTRTRSRSTRWKSSL